MSRKPAPLARMLRELERTLRQAAIVQPKFAEVAERAARQAEMIEARTKPEPLP